jgi:hypothetical protein
MTSVSGGTYVGFQEQFDTADVYGWGSKETAMKRMAMVLVASCIALPALADEVGVRVGPVGGTVGSDRHDTVVKEREVVREREPRDKVIVKEKSDPTVVEKKTIIHHD